MARTRAADYDAQRDRILELAVEAFARIGYPSASMASLADACGTSKARLYHYYPSKEAILFDAMDRHTRRLRSIVGEVQRRGLAPREELAEIVRAMMREYRSARAWHASLLNDVKFLDAGQRRVVEDQERAVVDAIAATIARAYPGRFAQARKPLTMALLGMINFTFAWLRPDGPMSYEQFAEMAIELWFRGLEGGPTTTPEHHEQAVRIQG
jgi:AcrR family transcriptional regulator